jgi:LPS sulfotransferase NodH
VAGAPAEYFSPQRRATLAARWGCGPGLEDYLRELQLLRSGENGVFGLKIHWPQLETLLAEAGSLSPGAPTFACSAALLEPLLGGPPVCVHVLRRDIDRQAVSMWIAQRSRRWSVLEPGAPGSTDLPEERVRRVSYSFAGIERCRRGIALDALRWDRFFRCNSIAPIEVVYEDLCDSWAEEIARVAGRLVPGLSVSPESIAPPDIMKLADARSAEFLRRYRTDLAGRDPRSIRERIRRRVMARLPVS